MQVKVSHESETSRSCGMCKNYEKQLQTVEADRQKFKNLSSNLQIALEQEKVSLYLRSRVNMSNNVCNNFHFLVVNISHSFISMCIQCLVFALYFLSSFFFCSYLLVFSFFTLTHMQRDLTGSGYVGCDHTLWLVDLRPIPYSIKRFDTMRPLFCTSRLFTLKAPATHYHSPPSCCTQGNQYFFDVTAESIV